MTEKFMYIPNDDTQIYPFCQSKVVVEMFGHWTNKSPKSFFKVPNVGKPTNEKTLL